MTSLEMIAVLFVAAVGGMVQCMFSQDPLAGSQEDWYFRVIGWVIAGCFYAAGAIMLTAWAV